MQRTRIGWAGPAPPSRCLEVTSLPCRHSCGFWNIPGPAEANGFEFGSQQHGGGGSGRLDRGRWAPSSRWSTGHRARVTSAPAPGTGWAVPRGCHFSSLWTRTPPPPEPGTDGGSGLSRAGGRPALPPGNGPDGAAAWLSGPRPQSYTTSRVCRTTGNFTGTRTTRGTGGSDAWQKPGASFSGFSRPRAAGLAPRTPGDQAASQRRAVSPAWGPASAPGPWRRPRPSPLGFGSLFGPELSAGSAAGPRGRCPFRRAGASAPRAALLCGLGRAVTRQSRSSLRAPRLGPAAPRASDSPGGGTR